MNRLTVLALATSLFLSHARADAQSNEIDALVRRTMAQWKIPGLAVAVVKDGRLVYLKGFGVRAAGAAEPVTPDTVFPIASCTKPVTALALGLLADDGKLAWDDPVRKHLPYFRLSDPLADADVRLRDLLTHRTGLAGHELLWYRAPWTLEERIRKTARLELAQPFRTGFQYQGTLFAAAGVAAGNAAGSSWQRLVQERVFGPLQMRSTYATCPGAAAKVELAAAHRADKHGTVVPAARYPFAEPDPSGSIHSTARDMAQFLRLQLGDGTWQGRRFISAANLAAPHEPQVVVRLDAEARALNPDTHFLHYGMGWVVQDYRGRLVVSHGGTIDGFRANLALAPSARAGVVVLSNLGRGHAHVALSNSLLDRLLGLPGKDWVGYIHRLEGEHERQGAARADALRGDRRAGRTPRDLDDYAGTYRDEVYGSCRVTVMKGKLVWSWANLKLPLEHHEDDTFLANNDQLRDAPFEFVVGDGGRVRELRALNRVFRREP